MNEITIVQGLQPEIGKLVITFGFERFAQAFEIKFEQFLVE